MTRVQQRGTPKTFDVIVVGGGGSGLAAAARAAEHGMSVLLLEKRPQLGGTTGIAIGSFTANRTSLQRGAGIDDSLDLHAEDAGRFAPESIEARNNEPLRRFFLDHVRDTYDWLSGLGLRFHGPSPEPPNRVPRMHNVIPNAKAYIAVLHTRLRQMGGVVLCNASVGELIREGEAVSGVHVDVESQQQEFRARRGVVLAAGDYAGSTQLIARFKGHQFGEIEGINPHATGDGQQLVESVGGRLVNMDVTYGPELRFVAPPEDRRSRLTRLPASGPLARAIGGLLPLTPNWLIRLVIKRLIVTWQHPEHSLFDDGAILINARGERFCTETASPEREIAVARQPDKQAYLLLDEWLIDRYSRWPHFISTAPKIAYAYVADYLKLRPDVAVSGTNLSAVAAARNIPAATLEQTVLEQTVQSHNRDADRPLTGGRWVLLGPLKAYFTTTEGSAAIDEQCRVLDEAARPIPGLYAVGQNGLGGMILWGHGLHIAWALTSGRMVGDVLAAVQSSAADGNNRTQ